ncbi:MAG: YlmH/Sll1252 family protein [Eubacteriales bacterium]|nr:YlmH/Sll1252 family protein [Eubacteriales bacterium]
MPVRLYGGYDGAERCVAALLGGEDDADMPVEALQITWNGRFDTLAHRDILGALMHMGLGRDSFGDIVEQEGQALVWVHRDLAGYVQENLCQIGRAAVHIRRAQGAALQPPARNVTTVTATVASLRLDALLGIAYGISREKAAQAIRAGLVKLNHVQQLHCDAQVQQGAVLSFRGKGRAVLEKVGGVSRKGRLFVEIQRYI